MVTSNTYNSPELIIGGALDMQYAIAICSNYGGAFGVHDGVSFEAPEHDHNESAALWLHYRLLRAHQTRSPLTLMPNDKAFDDYREAAIIDSSADIIIRYLPLTVDYRLIQPSFCCPNDYTCTTGWVSLRAARALSHADRDPTKITATCLLSADNRPVIALLGIDTADAAQLNLVVASSLLALAYRIPRITLDYTAQDLARALEVDVADIIADP